MRPRHKAAEYRQPGTVRYDCLAASMRPRHKAAEYHEAEQYTIKIDALASMRPRHKAAEYVPLGRDSDTEDGLLQ